MKSSNLLQNSIISFIPLVLLLLIAPGVLVTDAYAVVHDQKYLRRISEFTEKAFAELEQAAEKTGPAREKHITSAMEYAWQTNPETGPDSNWATTLEDCLRKKVPENEKLAPLVYEAAFTLFEKNSGMNKHGLRNLTSLFLTLATSNSLPSGAAVYTEKQRQAAFSRLEGFGAEASAKLLKKGEYDESRLPNLFYMHMLPLFEKYEQAYADSASFWKNWGLCALASVRSTPSWGQPSLINTIKSEEVFRKSLAINPEQPEVINLLGRILEMKFISYVTVNEALFNDNIALRKTLKEQPQNVEARVLLCRNILHIAKKKEKDKDAQFKATLEELLECSRALSALVPESSLALYAEAYALFHTAVPGLFNTDGTVNQKHSALLEKSITLLEKEITWCSEKNSQTPYENTGQLLTYALAVKAAGLPEKPGQLLIEKAVRSSPSHKNNVLFIFHAVPRLLPEKPRATLLRLLAWQAADIAKETPENPEIWSLWGEILIRQGETEKNTKKALEFYMAAANRFESAADRIESGYSRESALTAQARALYRTGELSTGPERKNFLEKAIRLYTLSLGADSTNSSDTLFCAWAYLVLGNELVEGGQTEKAATCFRLAEIWAMRSYSIYLDRPYCQSSYAVYLMARIRQSAGQPAHVRAWLEFAEKEGTLPGPEYLDATYFPGLADEKWLKEMSQRQMAKTGD